MKIQNLARLYSLLPMDSESSHDHHSLHFFCNQKVEIPPLAELHICNLHDDISKIWCRQVPNSFFHNLKDLKISDFNGIRNLMSSAIAINLVNLKELIVEGCQEMVVVVEDDEDVFVTSLFPKLHRFSIKKLQKIRSFCGWKHTFELPSLGSIEIDDCPAMETFSSGSLSSPNFPRLNTLLPMDSEPSNHSLHFFCHQKVEIPRLTKLHICNLHDDISKIWCRQAPNNFFHNLHNLKISDNNGIRNLMSSAIAINLVNLEELNIERCQEMVEVVEDEDEVIVTSLFPKLQWVTIKKLQKLRSFCRWKHTFELPSLESIEIVDCPALESLSSPNLPMDSEPSHDNHSLHFFCHQKVEIPRLGKLEISNLQDDISKIWCRQVPNNFFHNLKDLNISDVNGIRNLMQFSIAKNLVNLQFLHIKSCQEMVEVVEDDEEVFVTSLFPKLYWVTIKKLQKLRSFCPWKHTFELPSLGSIKIVDCPAMETFSLGSLSSPKLYDFSINGKELQMKVLNDGIRDHFMKKSQEGGQGIKILM